MGIANEAPLPPAAAAAVTGSGATATVETNAVDTADDDQSAPSNKTGASIEPADIADSAPTGDSAESSDEEATADSSTASPPAASDLPEASCLSRTICAIKNKIRWQTPAWKPADCSKIASAVLAASKQHNISPSLLLAIMINESDLNEKAARVSLRNNKVYAMDSGLMAVRCVLDRRKRCLNGNVRGMPWADLMNPTKNISVGAGELAYWRDGGAVTRTVVKVRDAQGRVRPTWKTVPCRHKDHAYWAHYNHGPKYIASGYPRHYPHRVAVLDHALATVLNVDAPELRGSRITIRDAGKRERTVDHPLEARYKKLCSQIQSVGGCSAVAVN